MKHITGKDLNLLLVFAALWRERNVTKAAQAIGMTQPALSRALGRLRHEFSDPLFVRVARGVAPTDRAVSIADTVVNLLASVDGIYSSDRFNPKSFRGVITIATSDYFEVISATALIPKLAKEAPGITLSFRAASGVIPKEAMEKGDIDLVISGANHILAEGFYKQKILTDPYKSAVGKNHPQKKITLDQFAKLSHVLVTPRGDLTGVVDSALENMGKRRRVVTGFSNFLSAGWAIAHTDFVLSAPGQIIDRLKEFLPIRDFSTPVPIPDLELFQIWHSRTHHDPAHRWLRQKIIDSLKV